MPRRCFKILPKSIIYALLLIIPLISSGQPHVSINQPFNDTLLCVGNTLQVNFTITSQYFDTTNYFTVQLSDTAGNFNSNTTDIGKIYVMMSYFVNCAIPANILPGAHYRLRIISSSPADTSYNNGKAIRISQYPVITAASNSPVCPSAGSTIHLYATGSPVPINYTWQGPNNFSATTQNPYKNNAQFSDSGKYIVTGDHYGCKSKDSIHVTVMTPPKAHILPQGIANTCEGDNFGLTDSSNLQGVIYSWKGPSNFIHGDTSYSAFIYVNIPSKYTGWFVLTASVNGGCSTKDSVWVNVLPRPDSPVVSSNSPVCLGDTIKLSGKSSIAGASFIWRGPNGFNSFVQNPFINNASYADAGIYYASAKHPNGCISRESKINVFIGTPVIPPIISGNNMLCKGDSLLLSANSPNPGIYQWKGPNNNVLALGKKLAIGNITTADAGIYSVTLNQMGCTSLPVTINMVVTDVPVPTATNNGPICDGSTLLLNAQDIPNASYSWKGPANFISTLQNPSIPLATTDAEGIYTVTAQIFNCSNSSSTHAEINPIPAITTISGNTPICIGSELNLHIEANIPNCSFAWHGPNGFSSLLQKPSLTMLREGAGKYYAKASAKGCTSAEDSVLVETKELPATPAIAANSPLNTGEVLELHATCATPGATLTWDGPWGFNSTEADLAINDITNDYNGEYTVTATYDGCISSDSINVTINALNRSIFTLFPNPNDGHFSLSGFTKTNSPVFMEILNMNGQIIYRSSALPIHKRFNFSIGNENPTSGLYILYITTVGERQSMRFVVK